MNSFLYFDYSSPALDAASGTWFYNMDLNGTESTGGQAGSPGSWTFYHKSLWSVSNGYHASYLYVGSPAVGSEFWHRFEEDASGAYLKPVGGSFIKIR